MKIKSGDKIKVLKGKDAGKEGIVKETLPKENRVIVEGINVYKKHQKSRGDKDPGGIISITRALRVENLQIICPKCGKTTRIGYDKKETGQKYRYCKKCKEVLTK